MSNEETLPRDSTSLLLRRAIDVGASLLGFSAVAYLVGWLWLRAYFEIHGAGWIAFDASVAYVLDASISPILAIAGGMYSAVVSCRSSWRWRRLDVPLFLGVSAFMVWTALKSLGDSSVLGFSRTIDVGLGCLAGAVFVLLSRARDSGLDSLRFLVRPTLGYVFIIGSLLLLPSSSGAIRAWRECSLGRSSLPRVFLKGETKEWRLLLSSGDRLHLVEGSGDCATPRVTTRTLSDVEHMLGAPTK